MSPFDFPAVRPTINRVRVVQPPWTSAELKTVFGMGRPPGFRITLGGVAAAIAVVALGLTWPLLLMGFIGWPVNWVLDRMVLSEPRRSGVILSFMGLFAVVVAIGAFVLR